MAKTNHTTNSVVEIRNYPASLIHKHKNEDGSEFESFSFLWNKNWASCVLPPGALTQSTTRKGEAIEGRMNIEEGVDYEILVKRTTEECISGLASSPSVNLNELTDYSKIKDKLSLEVVSAERNANTLKSIPVK